MDIWVGGLLAIVGGVVGSFMAGRQQQRQLLSADRLARSEKLRQERVDAYTEYAGALSEYRRSLMFRAEARLASEAGTATLEVEQAAQSARDRARKALFRVQLLAGVEEVSQTAEVGFRAMVQFSGSTTESSVRLAQDDTYGAVPTFLEKARAELEDRIVSSS